GIAAGFGCEGIIAGDGRRPPDWPPDCGLFSRLSGRCPSRLPPCGFWRGPFAPPGRGAGRSPEPPPEENGLLATRREPPGFGIERGVGPPSAPGFGAPGFGAAGLGAAGFAASGFGVAGLGEAGFGAAGFAAAGFAAAGFAAAGLAAAGLGAAGFGAPGLGAPGFAAGFAGAASVGASVLSLPIPC